VFWHPPAGQAVQSVLATIEVRLSAVSTFGSAVIPQPAKLWSGGPSTPSDFARWAWRRYRVGIDLPEWSAARDNTLEKPLPLHLWDASSWREHPSRPKILRFSAPLGSYAYSINHCDVLGIFYQESCFERRSDHPAGAFLLSPLRKLRKSFYALHVRFLLRLTFSAYTFFSSADHEW